MIIIFRPRPSVNRDVGYSRKSELCKISCSGVDIILVKTYNDGVDA